VPHERRLERGGFVDSRSKQHAVDDFARLLEVGYRIALLPREGAGRPP